MNYQVALLQQQPSFLHALAQWHQQEWRASGRSVPITRRVQRLRSHMKNDLLPNTWVAYQAHELLGSVSLVDYVFQDPSDASAWIANLFVLPQLRGRGLGRQLLAHAEQEAQDLDLQRLFLFTPTQRTFYEHQGWSFLHQARVQGQWVDVMLKRLTQPDNWVSEQQFIRGETQVPPSQSRW